MKEAIKRLLLAGHHVSLASNCRISPNGRWRRTWLMPNLDRIEALVKQGR